jgi:glycosyltransferase involved in cell wall biosynthesis
MLPPNDISVCRAQFASLASLTLMRRPRRILFTQKFASLGGSQKSLVHLFELIDRSKFEARLLVANTGWLTDECKRLGIPWELETFGHWKIGSWLTNWRLARRLRNYIRRHEIDLIHANEHWVGPHSGWAARLAGIPSVCHFRTGLEDLTPRRIRKYRYWEFDRVLPVADVLREALAKELPDPSILTVVRDGIEVEADDSPLWSKRSTQVIANVGAIYHVKGQAKIFQQAIPWLKADGKRFILFIGGSRADSEYVATLKQQVRDEGLQQQALFLGSRPDVPRLLKAADALTAYSTVEGVPRVVMEAMSRRRPVIVSNTPGMSEVVTDGVTGRIVNFDDGSGEFAQALESLAVNRPAWENMGIEARAQATARYSVEAMSSQIQQIYRELLPDE